MRRNKTPEIRAVWTSKRPSGPAGPAEAGPSNWPLELNSERFGEDHSGENVKRRRLPAQSAPPFGERMGKWKMPWNRTFRTRNLTESPSQHANGTRRELRGSSGTSFSAIQFVKRTRKLLENRDNGNPFEGGPAWEDPRRVLPQEGVPSPAVRRYHGGSWPRASSEALESPRKRATVW